MVAKKTRKATLYNQVNVPKDEQILDKLDRLCKLMERQSGLPEGTVSRWGAMVKAIDEAIEKRRSK